MEEKKYILGTEYYLYEKLGKIESDLEYQGKAIDVLKNDMNKRFDSVYVFLGFAILATLITRLNFI
ncbi:MAG: hypothetical protein B0D92_04755 [Spirochaeta sp. LUC14_002_19_P3]|nr:MAG: hypothetical protein B0D92_04755 [Spirochaeta sp. LUC14_002_19_P3]